jgi:transcriptional regulator with XRE-family HTH domain
MLAIREIGRLCPGFVSGTLSATLFEGMTKKTSVHVLDGGGSDAVPVASDSGGTSMGNRLRSVREARGLSLEKLAERSGISPEQLSHFENTHVVPSLGLLWKLSSGLGVAFADLLGRGGATVSLQRRDDSRVLRSEDGALESRPLVAAGANRWVEAYELTLAPGSAHASEPHPSGTREIVVVLDGALKIQLGAQEHELRPGDSISFKADLPHAYQNPGSVTGRYHDIIVYEY